MLFNFDVLKIIRRVFIKSILLYKVQHYEFSTFMTHFYVACVPKRVFYPWSFSFNSLNLYYLQRQKKPTDNRKTTDTTKFKLFSRNTFPNSKNKCALFSTSANFTSITINF